jgi:hypothetical protein
MQNQGLALFSIGALPYLLMFGALVFTSVFFFLTKLSLEDFSEIIAAMGTIWLVIILVLLFVSRVCMSISPVEHFTTSSIDVDLEKTEAAVCKLIQDVRNFITADIGQPGQDDPSLITAAMQKAVDSVNGPITICLTESIDKADKADKTDNLSIDDRLARMERTLDQLVEPQLKLAYDKAMTCEGFADSETVDPVPKQKERLAAIQATMDMLKKRYLDPLDKKQADLKAGHLSDCEKRKGANTAIPPKS